MRRNRPRRKDNNHDAIVEALRDAGCSVESLADVGRGVPDLLVGLRMRNFLLEIKRPDGPPSKRALTPDEKLWHGRWKGFVVVVSTPQEAIDVISKL